LVAVRSRKNEVVMKKILNIIWKDTILRFSSRTEMLFFLILPVVFTFILAGGTGYQGGDNRIHLLVVDQAQSHLSAQIITELEKSETVRPDVLTLDKAESEFDARNASVLLVIPVDCDSQTLRIGAIVLDLRQMPNNLNAQAAQRAVQAVLYRLGSAVSIAKDAVKEAEKIRPFASEADRQAYFDTALGSAQTLMNDAPDRVSAVLGGTKDPIEYDPRSNSSAGQMITWVFIPLIGISAAFAYERQLGTLRRLLTTPTGKGTFLLGSILGNVFWALVQMTLLVTFGVLVMKVNWADNPAALAVMMTASALAAAALGTMLGTFVKTDSQASGLSIMLGMVMALLGGCWYPIELFPQVVRNVVKILPTTWAMQGMLNILLRGQGVVGILPEAGILLGFASVFFVIGIWRFKYE
jgi:ABC-2 type transport system permease protein